MGTSKAVLPSKREKTRYLVYEVMGETTSQQLSDGMLGFLGVRGMAEAGVLMLNERFNKETQRGVMRVSARMVDPVKASLLFCQARTLATTGSLSMTERW